MLMSSGFLLEIKHYFSKFFNLSRASGPTICRTLNEDNESGHKIGGEQNAFGFGIFLKKEEAEVILTTSCRSYDLEIVSAQIVTVIGCNWLNIAKCSGFPRACAAVCFHAK